MTDSYWILIDNRFEQRTPLHFQTILGNGDWIEEIVAAKIRVQCHIGMTQLFLPIDAQKDSGPLKP